MPQPHQRPNCHVHRPIRLPADLLRRRHDFRRRRGHCEPFPGRRTIELAHFRIRPPRRHLPIDLRQHFLDIRFQRLEPASPPAHRQPSRDKSSPRRSADRKRLRRAAPASGKPHHDHDFSPDHRHPFSSGACPARTPARNSQRRLTLNTPRRYTPRLHSGPNTTHLNIRFYGTRYSGSIRHENSRISSQASAARGRRRRAATRSSPARPTKPHAAFKKLGGPLASSKPRSTPAAAAKARSRTTPSSTACSWCKVADEAKSVAASLLGNKLVTIQTGPDGQTVRRVLVEAGCDIARELYLGIVIDRAAAMPVLMASSAGGMNIEEVAAKTPELIFKEPFHPDAGLQPYQVRKLCAKLDSPAPASARPTSSCGRSASCSSTSIAAWSRSIRWSSPRAGELIALDAKISFDDNALFRHPQLAELRDLSEEDPNELRAGKAGLSYVQLDGNIGCLVNGAGLAMSTMDLIKLHGGEPANFLDVGGGANTEQVTEAFRILLADKNVKAVLVNIFGGIMRCTTIATAIVEAYKQVGFNVPLVVRLEGTEVEEGRKILAESGVDIIAAKDLTDAANKVVAAAKRSSA